MKKRIFALVMALCLVFALAACGEEETAESPAATEEAEESPAAEETPAAEESTDPEASEQPEALSAEVTFEEEQSTVDEDAVTHMTAHSVVPTVTIEGASEAAAAIESALAERLTVTQETIDANVELAKEQYAGLTEEETATWGGYSFLYSAEVVRSDGVLSVLCTQTSFTGGAHDNVTSFGLTFDLSTGELLSASDISEDYVGLKAKVVESVTEQAAEYEEGELTGDINAFAEGVLDTEEWYLSDEGLVVFASPYEIAPYAAGTISFTIPYSELEGLLLDSLTA